MEICPVCRKEEVKHKKIGAIQDGEVYYFCCPKCRENFTAEPRRFTSCCASSDDHQKTCGEVTRGHEGRDT